MAAKSDLPEVRLDPAGLYREEIYTDRRAGTIRRLTPVTVDGATDAARPVLFSGQTQLLTPAGVLPLAFEIEASTLEEALAKFPEGVNVALEQAIRQLGGQGSDHDVAAWVSSLADAPPPPKQPGDEESQTEVVTPRKRRGPPV